MNIFFLHQIAKLAAQMHFDSHVIKMILESVQLLSAAWWVCEPELASEHRNAGLLFKKYNPNHPAAIWVRESLSNYRWLTELVNELNNEHQFRYEPKREHKSMPIVRFLTENPPPSLKDIGLTPANLAMPDEYKVFDENGKPDVVLSYRKYYMSPMKSHLAKWRKREKPEWFDPSTVTFVPIVEKKKKKNTKSKKSKEDAGDVEEKVKSKKVKSEKEKRESKTKKKEAGESDDEEMEEEETKKRKTRQTSKKEKKRDELETMSTEVDTRSRSKKRKLLEDQPAAENIVESTKKKIKEKASKRTKSPVIKKKRTKLDEIKRSITSRRIVRIN